MSATPDIYDKHTMNTLNAYFHFIAACNYLDLPISDRKIFTNQAFMKQMIATRKEARIFITEIQKAYQASGIDIKSIEKESEGLVVDHVDNNKFNNRLDNLKLVTQRGNSNKDKKNKTSKFAGVSWHKSSKRWQSRVYHNGKIHYLGVYVSEKEAGEKYINFLEKSNQSN